MVDKLVETVAITGANGFIGSALPGDWSNRALLYGPLCAIRPICRVWKASLSPLSGGRVLSRAHCGVFSLRQTGSFTPLVNSGNLAPEDSYHDCTSVERATCLKRFGIGRTATHFVRSSPGVLGPVGELSADETFPLAPGNAYERSKAAAEMMVQRYCDRLPIVIARPEFVYGLVTCMCSVCLRRCRTANFSILTGGLARCHPTYVADAADGMVKALLVGKPGEIYHITD